MIPYPTKAKKTKKMQTSIHAAMAVMPSTLGELVVTMLKMLMSTRKRVMSMAIRPGTTSGGIRKPTWEKKKYFYFLFLFLRLWLKQLTQDTTTKSPEGR